MYEIFKMIKRYIPCCSRGWNLHRRGKLCCYCWRPRSYCLQGRIFKWIIKIYSHLVRSGTCDYFLHMFSKSNFQSLRRPHRSDTPQFSSVSPDHVSVRGGGLITIHGEYFGRDPAYNNVGDTAGSGFKVKFQLKFQNIKSSQFKTLLKKNFVYVIC